MKTNNVLFNRASKAPMIPIENKGELEPGAVRDFDILVVILFIHFVEI